MRLCSAALGTDQLWEELEEAVEHFCVPKAHGVRREWLSPWDLVQLLSRAVTADALALRDPVGALAQGHASRLPELARVIPAVEPQLDPAVVSADSGRDGMVSSFCGQPGASLLDW